jgi:hypothetical protein
MLIPRIIHQTWKDRYPHPALSQCIASFKSVNPDWEHRFYSYEDCEAWVRQKCSQILCAYLGFQIGIHCVAFFRVLVRCHEGQVHADSNMEWLLIWVLGWETITPANYADGMFAFRGEDESPPVSGAAALQGRAGIGGLGLTR